MSNTFYADLLQLFADGAGGSGETPVTANPQSSTSSLRGTPPAAAGQENLEADFAKLVGKGGKYEAAFQKQMQKSFNKRFAAFKEIEAKASRLDAFRKTVAQRYPNAQADDVDALEAAFLSDPGFAYAKQARANEMRMQREARLKAAYRRGQQDAEAKKFYESIVRQEKALQTKYKDFDFKKEWRDPRFRGALHSPGITMEDAYWLTHRAELTARAIQEAKAATVNSIAARGVRPTEGAASPTVPSTSKVDVRNMSDKDFLELYHRLFRN